MTGDEMEGDKVYCYPEKRSNIAQTTHLGLFLLLFTFFGVSGDFCPFYWTFSLIFLTK
jgi:hypothetical protein